MRGRPGRYNVPDVMRGPRFTSTGPVQEPPPLASFVSRFHWLKNPSGHRHTGFCSTCRFFHRPFLPPGRCAAPLAGAPVTPRLWLPFYAAHFGPVSGRPVRLRVRWRVLVLSGSRASEVRQSAPRESRETLSLENCVNRREARTFATTQKTLRVPLSSCLSIDDNSYRAHWRLAHGRRDHEQNPSVEERGRAWMDAAHAAKIERAA